MVMSRTQWICDKCGAKFKDETSAITCEKGHYKVVRVIGETYALQRKCPKRIQVEIEFGGCVKDVIYEVVEDGWGSK